MEDQNPKNPRILCLHGFRTSGEILQKLILRWPEAVTQKLDLVFLDGQFPARGKSDVEGIFDPPYYEWFQANEDFSEYSNFEECIAYIEDYMVKNGPFDGLLGFSQGAILAAALPGMQAQGIALGKVNKIKFLILISGAKFGGKKLGMPKLVSNAFSKPIDCPSLHLIGETDFMKSESIALLDAFVDPVVIHHPKGHTVPRLDDKSLQTMLGFIEKIQRISSSDGQCQILFSSNNGRSEPFSCDRKPANIFSIMEVKNQKKSRILCLHEFRTSGEILKKLVLRWPEAVTQKLDLVFLDGQCPAQGKSDVEGIFDPPYYEWFQANEDFSEYRNFEEFLAYIEDYMVKKGPFDGLLGFSQGVVLAAALPGMQAQGVALGKANKIKCPDYDISGAQFGGKKLGMPKLASNAFSKLIDCLSLHFMGETDFMKPESIALLEAFVEPVVIHHPKGHRVPRLDDKSLETMLGFIEKIQRIPSGWSRKDLMNGLHVGLLSFL